MEESKVKEMMAENDSNMLVGMLTLTVAGMILYTIGKKRGDKQARSEMANYVKGIIAGAGMNSKTEDK